MQLFVQALFLNMAIQKCSLAFILELVTNELSSKDRS